MNILVIGSGGREHALIWKIAQSDMVEKIYAVPGNGGINKIAESALVSISDHNAVIDFCNNNDIGLVVVGPEAPLVDGIADSLEAAGILVFGPKKAAARLEGSKDFTKQICYKYNIPTAKYQSFTNADEACKYIDTHNTPIVVKADGLAAGKGVIIAETRDDAKQAAREMLVDNKFGDAGSIVVIEEFLEGEEISFFALSDGNKAIAFGSAQDHKRVGDGDTGPNTGGMGTYSPAPVMTQKLHDEIMQKTINPLVAAMQSEGCPYKGVIFAGFMVTKDGAKLLEINVRFGDPETQSLMKRLDSDIIPLFIATAKGDLSGCKVTMKDDAALCVVMAAKGYPDDYRKGTVINNLGEAGKQEGVTIFHAGTKIDATGNFTANGGRVLGITANGKTVKEAQDRAYKAVDLVDWEDGFCRRDIGWRAVKKI